MRACPSLIVLVLAGCFNEPDYLGRACDQDAPCPGNFVCRAGRCEDPSSIVIDQGTIDTGVQNNDQGLIDAGVADLGEPDTGGLDTGPMDAGFDGGMGDTGPTDLGFPDMGNPIDRCQNPTAFPANNWEARYFALDANNNFGGCFGVENVGGPQLNVRYMSEGPLNDPNNINFGSRFTATRNFQAGVYTFTLHHDDGMRVFIDGAQIYERWEFGDNPNVRVVTPYLTAGDHQITIEHFDSAGFAVIEASYQRGCIGAVPPDDGFVLNYHPYNNGQIQTDTCYGEAMFTSAGFTFMGNAPPEVLNAGVTDNWAVIARGRHTLRGMTRFFLSHDDGMRVHVGGQTIYDDWQNGAVRGIPTDHYATGPQDLVIEKYDTVGDAEFSISWAQMCDLVPTNLTNDWFAAYYRVTYIPSPEDWVLNRDDCLGTEIRLGANLFSMAEPPIIQAFGLTQLWGAEYRATRTYATQTDVPIVHDDGLRLYLGNTRVHNQWTAPLVYAPPDPPITIPAGTHNIRIEYFQNNGGAQIQFPP